MSGITARSPVAIDPINGAAVVSMETMVQAIERLPLAVWPDVLQFIKFMEYKWQNDASSPTEDAALWRAVEAEQVLDDEERLDFGRAGELGRAFKVQGSALRALHTFLQEVDSKRYWCGLRKVATNDGNLLWLCPEHARFHGI